MQLSAYQSIHIKYKNETVKIMDNICKKIRHFIGFNFKGLYFYKKNDERQHPDC